MTAEHRNNGRTTRYVCMSKKSNYGDPFCQSLAAAPLDTLIAQLVLKTLEPAALEARLALANYLEADHGVGILLRGSRKNGSDCKIAGRS